MTFNNLNQFRENIDVGQEVFIINHFKNYSGQRIVIEKNSRSIVLGKEVTESEMKTATIKAQYKAYKDKYYKVSKITYQKAKDMNFKGNIIEFLAFKENKKFVGETINPSEEFLEGSKWFEMQFQ